MSTAPTSGCHGVRAAVAILLLAFATASHAADQMVLGKQFLVNNPSTPEKRKILFSASERATDDTIVGDPVTDGATLTISVDGGTSSSELYNLPSGTNPATGKPFWSGDAVKGFKYKDAKGLNGPVVAASIKKANDVFQIKAVILAKYAPIAVVPPNPGIGGCALLQINGGDAYDVKFGDGLILSKGTTLFKVSKPTLQGSCTMSDNAIFVSASDSAAADDSNCGLGPTNIAGGVHPCMTIAQGLTRALALGRARVQVANGTYAEALTLVAGHEYLGGYDPQTWTRDVAHTATIVNGVTSFGNHDATIVAYGITAATKLEGFVVDGSLNDKPGGNSYAIYVITSDAHLRIVNNVVFGGRGGPGTSGAAGTAGTSGAAGSGRNPDLSVSDSTYDAKDANGTGECNTANNRSYTNAGHGVCGPADVSGGDGGGNQCPVKSDCTTDANFGCSSATFHWDEFTALDGTPGHINAAGDGTPGAGGYGGDDMIQVYAASFSGYVCYIPPPDADPDPDFTNGFPGTNGSAGSNGTAATGCGAPDGSVIAGHWTGGSARPGIDGANGGGGGGAGAGGGGKCHGISGHTACTDGGGKDTLGGGGGGGGAGGCGGRGGGAGTSGGGAFGIFVVGTITPTITGNTLHEGDGGSGGSGGAGAIGGSGGKGGHGGSTGVPAIFCSDVGGTGGDGGAGGAGSGGGGGCGGASFGIYTAGVAAPDYCLPAANNAFTPGSGGTAGDGGTSAGEPGDAGMGGVIADCVAVASCTPTTCATEGANCGSISDGCGATLDCGTCMAPDTCSGGGVPNVCGCTPLAVCPSIDTCGSVPDGCGGMLTCGPCSANMTCGFNGDPSLCECNANCGACGSTCGGHGTCFNGGTAAANMTCSGIAYGSVCASYTHANPTSTCTSHPSCITADDCPAGTVCVQEIDNGSNIYFTGCCPLCP